MLSVRGPTVGDGRWCSSTRQSFEATANAPPGWDREGTDRGGQHEFGNGEQRQERHGEQRGTENASERGLGAVHSSVGRWDGCVSPHVRTVAGEPLNYNLKDISVTSVTEISFSCWFAAAAAT